MRGLAAPLLYAVVLAVCYAPVVFSGKTLQAPFFTTSGVVPNGPWQYSGRRIITTFDVDTATPAFYEWPLNRYIGDALRRGELPLWNPHQAAGAPLVVNYSTRAFFPYQMLLDVSPFELWDYFFVLRLWIAGWLTYCFLTHAGLGRAAATLGGLLYMLSGVFTWFVNLEQYVNAAMMLPLFFLAVEAFVARTDWRRAAYVAAAIGLNLLAGQPEVTLYTFVSGGLYGVIRWMVAYRGSSREARRVIVRAAVAVVLGFALAAPLLMPFAAHLPRAFHLHEAGGDMGVRDPAPPTLAVALFIPTFFELPTLPRRKPDNGRWDFLGGYGGVLAPFLLVAGIVGPRWRDGTRRSMLLFFGGVWAWIMLKNFGVHPFDWIGYLPLFNQAWTPRWAGPTWCFALSAGAAFGLARLEETPEQDRATRARILLSLAIVLLGSGALAAYSTLEIEALIPPFWPFFWPGALGGQAVAAAVLVLAALMLVRPRGVAFGVGLLGLALVERWLPIPRGYAPDWLALRLIPVGLGLLAVTLTVFRQRLVAGVFAAAALVGAIVLDETAQFGLSDRYDPATPPPVVRFLKERAGYDRIMGDHHVIAPNYASVFGLYDVRYVEALAVDWLHRFVFEGLETSQRVWWHSLWFTGEPEVRVPAGSGVRIAPGSLEHDLRVLLRGYSLLSARYFLVPPGMDLNSRATKEGERFPIVYRNEVVVYENPEALPRAFVVGEWEPAPGPAEARTRALFGRFDPSKRAVVEAAPPRPGGGRGRAAIVEYRGNRVALDVETDGPALVVLTDTFYPGWRAWVDRAPADIYRVNGVVRGVFVDGGRHRIVMRFFPLSEAIGLAVGAVALAACIAMASPKPRWLERRRGTA